MNVEQEPDRVNGRFISITAAVSVAITGIGVLIAWVLMDGKEGVLAASPRSAEPPREVSQTEMTLFRGEVVTTNVAARRMRESFGWVNRERRVVHIPLERAIDLYIDRRPDQRKPPVPLEPPPRENR
ncbi:MAG TPA: hypothetical protein VKY73_00195 [Polyangiaceae bacterium]|nr:hypothetical protein [Polyangiaceae bacterium]